MAPSHRAMDGRAPEWSARRRRVQEGMETPCGDQRMEGCPDGYIEAGGRETERVRGERRESQMEGEEERPVEGGRKDRATGAGSRSRDPGVLTPRG